MYRPQKLVAALFSAALLCTTGIALADKGGNHDKHGPQGSSAPGQSSTGAGQSASAQRGPGGIGGPRAGAGPSISDAFGHSNALQGQVDMRPGRTGASFGTQAGVSIKLASGQTRTFGISGAAFNALKAHDGQKELIFFTTNGRDVTAVSALGEKMNMRVVARSGNTFTLQSADGQSRLITLDAKTASRLHVKMGANLQLTAFSATSGKVVALDLAKAHDFDKFAPGRGTAAARQAAQLARMNAEGKTPPGLPHQCINPAGNTRGWCKSGHDVDVDVDVAKRDVDRAKVDIDVAKTKKAKKADIDVVKADIDTVKADVDTAKGKKSKKLDRDVAKLDNDTSNLDIDVANGKCGHSSSRSGNPAFANQMAKDAANDASGHNPPGLPHECVNPAGHTRGFCKSASSESICGSGSGGGGGENEVASSGSSQGCPPGTKSRSRSNPAFANQMAKDEANDISGHNPPGLPHECVNPAGHTRGFCKSRSSESSGLCGSAVASASGGSNAVVSSANGGSNTAASTPNSGVTPLNTHGGIAAGAASNAVRGSERGPGAPFGAVPVAGGTFASGSRGGGAAAARPTHVLGAEVGPAGGRRVAALPTRVLPVAIQPVGKRRCVWYKTGVLGASMGPRIIGTSATSGKPVLHKKCR